MEQTSHIRMATANDLTAMLAIYIPIVRNTAISFEYEPPTLEEFTARFAEVTRRFPWVVAEVDGEVCGYTYAGPLFARSAYMWNAELSTYVAEEFRRRKLGEKMICVVNGLLTRMGYYKVYARIAALNLPSIRLVEQLGFEREGCLRNVGFKLGQWHDMVMLAKTLCPPQENPEKPKTISELPPVLLRADAEDPVDA